MKLFLTSSVHAVAHDIAKKEDLARGNKLVFITTPAEPKEERNDLEWLRNDRQALVSAGFEVQDYTITGKSKSQIETDLAGFDYIYMSGGDTSYLLEQSQKSDFINLIKDLIINKGKTYIGASAGSIITGPKLPEFYSQEGYELKDRNCYGFVNFTILPHWGSGDFKEKYLGKRLEISYKDTQVPLLLLTDNQYVIVQDNRIQIIDLVSK